MYYKYNQTHLFCDYVCGTYEIWFYGGQERRISITLKVFATWVDKFVTSHGHYVVSCIKLLLHFLLLNQLPQTLVSGPILTITKWLQDCVHKSWTPQKLFYFTKNEKKSTKTVVYILWLLSQLQSVRSQCSVIIAELWWRVFIFKSHSHPFCLVFRYWKTKRKKFRTVQIHLFKKHFLLWKLLVVHVVFYQHFSKSFSSLLIHRKGLGLFLFQQLQIYAQASNILTSLQNDWIVLCMAHIDIRLSYIDFKKVYKSFLL